jgi:uncharacterized protein
LNAGAAPQQAVTIAVISDTHMPKGDRSLPDACVERLGAADLVVHAGDVTTVAVLEAIEGIGPPVVAVHGNVDDHSLRRRLPAERRLRLAGVTIAVVHDAGPAGGRMERLRRRFPEADAVIFGHSHIPLHERLEGFQIFNPGSPTERRRAPERTMGVAHLSGGHVMFEHVSLG